MDTHRVPDARSARGARFGRLVGALLITEGVLFAILRFLTLVYVVASEAYNADRFRTPLPDFVPWVVISATVSFALVWTGSFLRRTPGGAWREVGLDARIFMVTALVCNIAALASSVAGLARTPATVEATLTWVAIGTTSLVVIVGLIRDVVRGRARV